MPTAPAKTTANLGTSWMTPDDIRITLAKIATNRHNHDTLVRSANSNLAQRRQQLENSLDGIGERDRNSMVSKAISGYRAELVRQTKDNRLALTRELGGLAERVRKAEALYRSPMQLLMRDTLGSERRSRIQQQIENSGPVELASLAELAAATKDKELAAALCGRVHGMKRDDRPFNAGELSDILFGELHRELSQALVEAERRVLEALNSDQEFETGKSNPQRSIDIAMLKKREQEIGAYGYETEEDEAHDDQSEADETPTDEPASTDRIAAGLAARRAA
ncbi:hypothetical protein [Altererythrobacter epoxidivorans]|nr:hypothetical protein [Altererythrobacter epoxidivorans]